MKRSKALHKAFAAAGSGYALAKELKVSRQTVYNWKRVPAERVLAVEKITGVPRHDLRPDLYPREPGRV